MALSHASIVTVREMVVGDTMDQVYMVMAHFDHDLKSCLKRHEGPLPPSLTARAGAPLHPAPLLLPLTRPPLLPPPRLTLGSGRAALAALLSVVGLARQPRQPRVARLLVALHLAALERARRGGRRGPARRAHHAALLLPAAV